MNANERLELLERFVDRIAEYFDYTHDDVNEVEILHSIQGEAAKLHNPDRRGISELRFTCDCGQVYGERAIVRECQAANHSAAPGCELADAERTEVLQEATALGRRRLDELVRQERERLRVAQVEPGQRTDSYHYPNSD